MSGFQKYRLESNTAQLLAVRSNLHDLYELTGDPRFREAFLDVSEGVRTLERIKEAHSPTEGKA